MGLFKEIYCAHCGKKTGLLTRKKLRDEQYVCSNCMSSMPRCIKESLDEGDYENFKRVKEYISYSNNELSKIFRKTHSFYSLHIDTAHKLFYFDTDHPRVYYQMEQLSEFDLDFVADEVKEGFLSDKVTGKILITIKVDHPNWYKSDVFESYVNAKANVKGIYNKRAIYENPKGMDEFLYHFTRAWNIAREELYTRLTRELEEIERG